ncbi:hypothetical protein AB0P17_36515 [Streptomyces sp. NPDC088124]|uniref:hypothetical protein n=1 Tax=Streptomyces sp. NPDC088124 TaxID=3154654 RepID=UPI0034187062
MQTDMIAVPKLNWTRTEDGWYTATDADGASWSIDRHPTVPSRQNDSGSPDWREKWWLHPGADDGNPEIHETCPIVTSAPWTALHRHPEVLRYADVLAAGWRDECWRIANGTPLSEKVMGRGVERAPLSALLGAPVLVHPQLLLDEVLRATRHEGRAYAAEQALREAGLPVPGADGRGDDRD